MSSFTGVIVCADDFAVHQSASLGIAKLARMGRISATSAMVLSPRWAQDVALLHELRGQIDVGLHLDWTSDFAVAAGHGLSLGQAMRRALLGGFDVTLTRGVIERQLDLFEARWKAPPDFVDGHQHVQQFAGIRQALVALLQQRYGTQVAPPYLRISRAPPGLNNLKSLVI
ncbi:MAG: ChbG/HpnK family deacetylase, partial [Rhodoferax sp.]|nr:ChbG/HpnK family deacetylase [Rhodoferax sp.]